MKSKVIWALAALNTLLLVGLLSPFGQPNAALAQAGRSEYIMIPGEVVGGSSAVVYVIDETQGRLSAVALDPTGRGIDTLPPVDLGRMLQPAAGGGR